MELLLNSNSFKYGIKTNNIKGKPNEKNVELYLKISFQGLTSTLHTPDILILEYWNVIIL